jgi:membrane protein insertase Oxa1/YidC/SpoIIIJ
MILDLKNGVMPELQSWLWIKNVFQPDSFASTILPAFGDQLMAITPVGYSSILTEENITMAREFLSTAEYAAIASEYGAGQFIQLQLNFIIARPLLTIPKSVAALMQYANGLFILPVLAGASQFLMTQLQNGKMTEEQKAAQANNSMNSGFMKWFFPLFSVWICSTSNAAFSIYWMAANVIAIVQNWAMNLYFDRQDALMPTEENK